LINFGDDLEPIGEEKTLNYALRAAVGVEGTIGFERRLKS